MSRSFPYAILFIISVFLLQGTLKGLLGIICDATPTHVMLELHSQFRKVPVARENVALLDSGGRIMDTQYGATTPRITPMREMRTPQVSAVVFCLVAVTEKSNDQIIDRVILLN